MKEQYQRAVSQIHVPSELLLKTKQAMKEEEARINGQGHKEKVIPFRMISMVAAAVLMVIIAVPMASGLLRTGSEEEMAKPQMQLAGTMQPELGAIPKGDVGPKQVLAVTKADMVPEEWTETEEVTVAGKQILLAMDEMTGYYMAYDAEEGQIVTSEIADKEMFLKELENEL